VALIIYVECLLFITVNYFRTEKAKQLTLIIIMAILPIKCVHIVLSVKLGYVFLSLRL
jgi:hypothetical protein